MGRFQNTSKRPSRKGPCVPAPAVHGVRAATSGAGRLALARLQTGREAIFRLWEEGTGTLREKKENWGSGQRLPADPSAARGRRRQAGAVARRGPSGHVFPLQHSAAAGELGDLAFVVVGDLAAVVLAFCVGRCGVSEAILGGREATPRVGAEAETGRTSQSVMETLSRPRDGDHFGWRVGTALFWARLSGAN